MGESTDGMTHRHAKTNIPFKVQSAENIMMGDVHLTMQRSGSKFKVIACFQHWLSKESVHHISTLIHISNDLLSMNLDPFKPNGINHHYQSEQSISILRDVGWYFPLLLKF